MSVTAMGRIFWTEFTDLSYTDKTGKVVTIKGTTAKIVMLAIADNADDFGENSYQSFETLAKKCSLERRSVMRVTRALVVHGYLKVAGLSRYGTNNYSICLAKLGQVPPRRAVTGRPRTRDRGAESGDSGAGTSDSGAESGDAQSPYPSSIPPSQPSKKHPARATPSRAPAPAEVLIFRSVTGKYPQKVNYPDVVRAVGMMSERLGVVVSADDLRPFYAKWCARNYNPGALTWLVEWAVTGNIPEMQRGAKPAQSDDQRHAANVRRIQRLTGNA